MCIIQPYYYVRNSSRRHDVSANGTKEAGNALAESMDLDQLAFGSYRNVLQLSISVESIPAIKHILDIKRSKTLIKHKIRQFINKEST